MAYNQKIDELVKDVAELQLLVAQSQRQRTKDVLTIEIRKLDTELVKLRATVEAPPAAAQTPAVPAAASSAAKSRYQCELTQYAFDQSDKFVKLYVTLDGVERCAEANVTVEFTESTLTLLVQDLNGKDYRLQIKNLLQPIDVSKSHRKLKPGMVAIYAKKVKEGSKWSDLTLIEKRMRDSKAAALEPEKDDAGNTDPGAGLMNIMQKMYNSGDAEMKKLISKAWTEGEEKRRSNLSAGDQ